MKILSEKTGLERLERLRSDFTRVIRDGYERKARSCITCETPGACCLDAHFVNIHITRLEAVAISKQLDEFGEDHKREVYDRINETIAKYGLTGSGDTFAQTYACPLFEKGTGCLVHASGKPLPCIVHACYERKEDLPPDELLAEQENAVDDLNEKVYGKPAKWLPLPVAICQNRLPVTGR